MIRARTERPARDRTLALGFLVVALLLLNLLAAKPAHAATFTVNRTGDAPDANLANARCDVNASQRGNQCTLRAAIQEANDTTGADLIRFNIVSNANVKTISPASALPTITEAVAINGYSQEGASPNTLANGNDAVLKVQLNGTNAGAGTNGLAIQASDTTIRGLVINRFAESGVLISGSGAAGNRVSGNFVGTDAGGTADRGNTRDGVDISQADDNTVGGTVSGARNIISANGGDGVVIFGDDATGNKVQGNFIGTGANGTSALGNDDGVVIVSASDSTVGSAIGSTAGGNRIAHNDQDGVLVFGGLAVGNRILSNSTFSNGETGIDLGGGTEDAFGVTANDLDDPDAPSSNHHRQNFPVITSSLRSNSTNFTTIRGTLNTNPSQSYTIQCFVATPDPSGHGEGQILVAQTTATTNASGDASFACVSPVPQAGQAVSATATNTSGTASGTAMGDTSEFSRNVGVVLAP